MVDSGNYNLRASPVAGVGGMFATGNGTFKVVTIAAQVPPNFGRQTWQINPVEGKDDIYTIVEVSPPEISLGGSWSLEDSVGVPSGPIIAAEAPGEWYIIPTDNGIIDTYYIRPVTKDVGVDYYVGTNPGNQVVIVDIPINPSPPAGKIPYWQFNATS